MVNQDQKKKENYEIIYSDGQLTWNSVLNNKDALSWRLSSTFNYSGGKAKSHNGYGEKRRIKDWGDTKFEKEKGVVRNINASS